MHTVAPHDSFSAVSTEILEPYRDRLLHALEMYFPTLAPDSRLKEACYYALRMGGKRLRPALVYMVADALKCPISVDLPALIVEFFHIASLISDDLPCMDNDDFRRGVPTTHKVFSESIALLSSFSLTAAGFELLAKASMEDPYRMSVLPTTLLAASRAIGATGLIGGQHFDLFPNELRSLCSQKEAIFKIMELKTGALFSLSFQFGWIFGRGDLDHLDTVAQLAIHFGRAFQILDDIDDYAQDRAADKQVNSAILLGPEAARRLVVEEADAFERISQDIGLTSAPLESLIGVMRMAALA